MARRVKELLNETAANQRLYAECKRGAPVDLPALLDWLADRMVHVYGEDPDADFVLITRERSKKLRLALKDHAAI